MLCGSWPKVAKLTKRLRVNDGASDGCWGFGASRLIKDCRWSAGRRWASMEKRLYRWSHAALAWTWGQKGHVTYCDLPANKDQHTYYLEEIQKASLMRDERVIVRGGESPMVMRGGGQTGDTETNLRPAGQMLTEKSILHSPFHPAPLAHLHHLLFSSPLPLTWERGRRVVLSSIIYSLMYLPSLCWLFGFQQHHSCLQENNRPSTPLPGWVMMLRRLDEILSTLCPLSSQNKCQHLISLFFAI